jgi:hypothetical protein
VVWITDLPALWEFLRLYSPIGLMLAPCLPGDHDDEADAAEPPCAACLALVASGELPTDTWECPHRIRETE